MLVASWSMKLSEACSCRLRCDWSWFSAVMLACEIVPRWD